jgi:hypothetical protein
LKRKKNIIWNNCKFCGKKYKKRKKSQNFCSISCSRKKEKILYNCDFCKKEFIKKRKRQKFCSTICAGRNNIGKVDLQKAGLASANKRVKRSKNEIYFAELCEKHFENVETNEKLFNGWDADVIIHDIKTAVLWNGKWHYEKITESHSLKQVQNRDRIKLKEIVKYGYKPYIIKDMGKHNKVFVEEKFKEFICEVIAVGS